MVFRFYFYNFLEVRLDHACKDNSLEITNILIGHKTVLSK